MYKMQLLEVSCAVRLLCKSNG